MTNVWLQMHKPRVDTVIYNCEECRLRGEVLKSMSFGDIIFVLKGACTEIEKLQKEIDQLQRQISTFKPKEIKKDETVILKNSS